jgi:outer membrane protein
MERPMSRAGSTCCIRSDAARAVAGDAVARRARPRSLPRLCWITHWSTALNRLDRLFFVILLLTFLPCTAGVAADYKIGVVNAPRVLEAAPQAEAARKKLEKEFATRDRDLVAAQKELKGLEDRFTKDGAIMSESERSRLERDIINKRRELKRETTEFQEDVNFRRNEEMAKIQNQIADAIVDLSKEQGFDIVLGTGVVFASEKVDVTDAVIERLKKSGE